MIRIIIIPLKMFLQCSYNTLILFFYFPFFFFLHSVPYAYDDKPSSMMTKFKCLVSWNKSTMGEKWRVCLCKRRWGREGGQNTVRKKSDVPTQHDGPLRLKTLPLQQDGEGRERERKWGVMGGLLLFSSREPTTTTSSSSAFFSPLHSVLSSRCQEVAQCLIFFLLKGCMISHVFFSVCFIQFCPPQLEEQTGSQRVSGRFVCCFFCVSSCHQSLDSVIRSSGSSWSVVVWTTHTPGTVYGRIRDTLHYQEHP